MEDPHGALDYLDQVASVEVFDEARKQSVKSTTAALREHIQALEKPLVPDVKPTFWGMDAAYVERKLPTIVTGWFFAGAMLTFLIR